MFSLSMSSNERLNEVESGELLGTPAGAGV